MGSKGIVKSIVPEEALLEQYVCHARAQWHARSYGWNSDLPLFIPMSFTMWAVTTKWVYGVRVSLSGFEGGLFWCMATKNGKF